MTGVKIYCRDCGNHADHGGAGFEVKGPTVLLLEMVSGMPGDATCLGYSLDGNQIQAVIDAYKRGEVQCVACGGKNVELVCEVDVIAARKEAMVISDINFDNLSNEIGKPANIVRSEGRLSIFDEDEDDDFFGRVSDEINIEIGEGR